MQKLILINDGFTMELDRLIEEGWKIINVYPASTHTNQVSYICAYVLLEKNNNSMDNLSPNRCVVDANSKSPNDFDFELGYKTDKIII